MAPVVRALRGEAWAEVRVLATAQHRHLLDQMLEVFGIRPDIDLDVMQPDQPLSGLTARLIEALDRTLAAEVPDIVLGQGDTTTVFATALACFYRRIPFGHVEAGLRTGNAYNPYPEEMNRALAARLTRWHFAPTTTSRENLMREGISSDDVSVTGNTVIDALLDVAARDEPLPLPLDPTRRLILVTAHRRENFGAPLEEICRALGAVADANPDVQILYPVHPNPNVRRTVFRLLEHHGRITLSEPLDYPAFVGAMKRCHLILSDSGGIQEEAPALAKPVLVLRTETERPEALQAGVVRLVGTGFQTITSETQRLLDDQTAYDAMRPGISPYGDGKAAGRIVSVLATAAGMERVTV